MNFSNEAAVTLLKGGKINYRALVTDINPAGKIDGWEVKKAREVDPEFPIVYITVPTSGPRTASLTASC
jgi:hypothetical protein